jgi:membrane protease YdiL (CAAX protease family)
LATVAQAVVIGMVIVLAGTIPRNLLFAANLQVFPTIPWAVAATAVYLWFFWRYLHGDWPGDDTAATRRTSLRANALPSVVWFWALLAGGLGIVALVLALRIANRFVALPDQTLPPELAQVPPITLIALLLAAAPIAAIIEEAAFRGYMQGPIEHRYGLVIAILITGTMFALAHLDFTWQLWPYYVAVAALYGTVTHLTDSILPAIVLHTAGNLYSNFDLWLHGRAEWQAGNATGALSMQAATLALIVVVMMWAYATLARVAVSGSRISRPTYPSP